MMGRVDQGAVIAKTRVFTSYDLDLDPLLVGQSKHEDSPFEIADWSIKITSPNRKEDARKNVPVPNPGQLCRVVFVAAGLIVIAVACGGGDTSGPSGLDDRTSGSTIALVDEMNHTPSDDELAPTADGEDRRGELVGRWEVANYALPDGGGLTNVFGDAPVFIEFGVDGTLSYSTGCNEGTTGYRASGVYVVPESALDDTPRGQPITIGPSFEQTEIACDGFLGDQDRDLPSDMGAATRFVLDGDLLLLLDDLLLVEATKTR